MATLCLEYRAVSVEYFLDKMQWYEVYPLMTNLHLCVKTGWEQTREVMFSTLSPYLKKGTKLRDIMSFPWDDEKEKRKNPSDDLTEQKMKDIFSRAEERRKRMENNDNKER